MSRPGILSQRVTLEAPQRVADGGGGAAVTWIVEDVLWAHVEAVSGRESLAADATVSRIPYKVTLRSHDGLTPEKRLIWRGRVLEINAVLDDGEGGYVTCLCSGERNA